MLKSGDTFGAYRIVAPIRAGGMARLYLARREGAAGFSRPVALKVIHPHLAREAELVQMFIDEASLSSKIHDPNVVHVEDLGRGQGDQLFLAMEYVHGASLDRVLKAVWAEKRGFAPSFVAHLAAEIASGLHAAHETKDETGRSLGIVHRDVSPSNVLVSYRGHVKVIDFGVAKAFSLSQGSHSGALHGKLSYMSPEQARSEPLDRRADLYALGIVLWEMIAGKRLFQASNDIALLEMVRKPNVERPSKYVANVPPSLEEIVMKLLEPDRTRRPATGLEVKRLLLDAVPEARSIEADEVAGVLHSLLGDQIAKEDVVLAEVKGDESDPHQLGEPTTMKVGALEALTIALETRRDPPRSSEPEPARSMWGPIALTSLGLLSAVGIAIVLSRSAKSATPDPNANAFPPPAASPAVLPPATVTVVVPLAESAPVPAPAASPSAVPTQRKPLVTKPRVRAPAASSSARKVRVVGGVELYDE